MKYIFGTVIAVVLILALAYGMLYIAGFFRQTNMNINREVTQHSQEYVETKRTLLLSLIADAEGAEGAQKVAITDRFCTEYQFVDFDVPESVHSYARGNC